MLTPTLLVRTICFLQHTHTHAYIQAQTVGLFTYLLLRCVCAPQIDIVCVINWLLVQSNVIGLVQWGQCGRRMVYGSFKLVCVSCLLFTCIVWALQLYLLSSVENYYYFILRESRGDVLQHQLHHHYSLPRSTHTPVCRLEACSFPHMH